MIPCSTCGREHRLWHKFAACYFADAAWVSGNGRYAVVAKCPPLTVELHSRREQAETALSRIARSGCGSTCVNRHGTEDLAVIAGTVKK